MTIVLCDVHANPVLRFCGQDEEHDPSEDFEEPLACAVCGDFGKSNPSLVNVVGER